MSQFLNLLAIFGAGYVSVFSLGFQSRNVNNGNYFWAAGTSLFVGLSQAAVWTHVTQEGSGFLGWATYAVSGCLAIVSAMYVHERFIKKAPHA